MKKRIVILGANGFIGTSIIEKLQEDFTDIKKLTSKDCDLLDSSSVSALQNIIQDEDIFIFAAAKAPVKNWDMFETNMHMVKNLIQGLQGKKINYLLNISSDAVYSDSDVKINENSQTIPDSPHGYMHFVRETMINKNFNFPIGHIRPTLVFGEKDPHNGYGPNMFLRLAKKGENILLFGQGEELRDHIYVKDVAKIASCMIKNKIELNINAVSNSPITFMEIAKIVKHNSDLSININVKDRNSPMPHNGLRIFEKSKITSLFPNFNFLNLKEYIKKELND